jgi:hypothetical protein
MWRFGGSGARDVVGQKARIDLLLTTIASLERWLERPNIGPPITTESSAAEPPAEQIVGIFVAPQPMLGLNGDHGTDLSVAAACLFLQTRRTREIWPCQSVATHGLLRAFHAKTF